MRCGTTRDRARLTSVAAMSSVTRPRGRLPQRVYWVRRVLVLGTALALVVGIGSLLDLGSDGSSGSTPTAVQAAGEGSPSPNAAATSAKDRKHKVDRATSTPEPPLPQPTGLCQPGDITISPVVPRAYGDSEVTIRLELATRYSPACTWPMSADTLTYKIANRKVGDFWSSLDCPGQVPTRTLTLRKDTPVWTTVTWDSRGSAHGCPGRSDWALPDWYVVSVAAFDGEPVEVAFRLRKRDDTTPTPTAEPTAERVTSDRSARTTSGSGSAAND